MSLFYEGFYGSLRHKPESDGRLFFHRTSDKKKKEEAQNIV